ncbi:MAG: TetR/AcrR family transcriptional regulator [bacterium]|nr:TetR/AcrR family transcriptional regulator [bacterium]MCP5041453.1 TetR/AcrR family transcriptional regulator [bacterium]
MTERKFSKRLTPQGAESRERLLQGAIDLISERGYAATSVDAICRHAGTAKTALYWHFKSKEGLLNAIIERVNEDWIEEIAQSIASVGDPSQRLDVLVDHLRSIVENKPHLLRLLLSILLERGDQSEETRKSILRVFRRSGVGLMVGIERDLGQKIPRVEMVAHTILGLLQMALVRRIVEPEANLDMVFADLRRTIILVVADRVNNPGVYGKNAGDAGEDSAEATLRSIASTEAD